MEGVEAFSQREMGPLKISFAARDRAARVVARKRLGRLHSLVISDTTFQRYEQAVRTFFAWGACHHHVLPCNPVAFDHLIMAFIESRWEEGDGRSLAADTLSGLEHFVPSLRKSLHGSWRLISAWQKRELPNRAAPFTLRLSLACIEWSLRQGLLWMACAVAVGFYCLLRSGEAFEILSKDISLDPTATHGVLYLGLTKSGQRRGAAEAVTIDCSLVARLLAVWQLNTLPGDMSPRQADFAKSSMTCLQPWKSGKRATSHTL